MNEFIYADYAIGNVNRRNNIQDIRSFKLNGVITDCYRSIFLFDESLKFYVEKTNSVTGYAGPHTTELLLFDFDSDDLEAVKNEVYNFVNHLFFNYDIPFDYIRIAFSGSKGFHISIPMTVFADEIKPSEKFYQVYKNVAQELSEGFKFVDYSIYELKRLFRITNTIHSKTRLYKVPITLDELKLSIEDIKALATAPRMLGYTNPTEMIVVETLGEIYNKWLNYKPISKGIGQGTLKETSQADDLLSILREGVAEGNRHAALIRLTAAFLNKGLTYKWAYECLKSWNQKNTPPLPDERLESESFRVYEDGKKDSTGLVNTTEFKIYSISDGLEEYHKFTKEDQAKKVQIGYELIDKKIRGISPGETMCVIGKTSVGKSAFLQNIGFNYAKASKQPVLFFSMEMPMTSVIERSIQIECDMTGFEVEEMFRKDFDQARRKANLLLSKIPNFYCVEKSGLDLGNIKEYIAFAEENIYKGKTGLILIDYLGLVREKGKDLYEQISKVARGIKELAKETKTPIIYLSQTTKAYSEYDELSLGSARDSGSVDEASDFILGLWKEKDELSEEKRKEIPLICGIIKNRKGGLGKINLIMDKRNLTIH